MEYVILFISLPTVPILIGTLCKYALNFYIIRQLHNDKNKIKALELINK